MRSQLFVGLANQVARADRALDAGKREIDFVAELRGLFRGGFDLDALFFNRRFDMRFEFVQFLADDALQFRRRRFQPVVGDLREHAGLAAGPLNQEGFPAFRIASSESRPARRNGARTSANSAATPASAVAPSCASVCVVGSIIVMERSFGRRNTRPARTQPDYR